MPIERRKTTGLVFECAAQTLTNIAKNPSEFACEDGIPGSALRAVGGRASLSVNFKALQRMAARMLPSTHQAQTRSLLSASVVNTAALTIHLVDSLMVSSRGWCWRAAGSPSFPAAAAATAEAEAATRRELLRVLRIEDETFSSGFDMLVNKLGHT